MHFSLETRRLHSTKKDGNPFEKDYVFKAPFIKKLIRQQFYNIVTKLQHCTKHHAVLTPMFAG